MSAYEWLPASFLLLVAIIWALCALAQLVCIPLEDENGSQYQDEDECIRDEKVITQDDTPTPALCSRTLTHHAPSLRAIFSWPASCWSKVNTVIMRFTNNVRQSFMQACAYLCKRLLAIKNFSFSRRSEDVGVSLTDFARRYDGGNTEKIANALLEHHKTLDELNEKMRQACDE